MMSWKPQERVRQKKLVKKMSSTEDLELTYITTKQPKSITEVVYTHLYEAGRLNSTSELNFSA